MKHGVLAACIGAGGMVLTAVVCVIRPQPLHDPRIVIPITGMVLGNAFSAVSLALRTVLMELAEHPVGVRSALYFGADRQEALRPSIITALTTALTPSINSMTVIGTLVRHCVPHQHFVHFRDPASLVGCNSPPRVGTKPPRLCCSLKWMQFR